jgi:hypothetical protein
MWLSVSITSGGGYSLPEPILVFGDVAGGISDGGNQGQAFIIFQ